MQLSFTLMKILEKLKLILYVVTQITTGNWLSHTFEDKNICWPQDPTVFGDFHHITTV
jgi:hypothetical protein